MTRTSAIFGVVSVLTAAIVGGVFIRKKIIDDALYWRAWIEAEGRWKREIKELERDISTLESSISSENKSKVRKEREVEGYEENIKELSSIIQELEEKMSSSRHYSIPKQVANIVNKNFGRQGDLKEKIREFTSEINKFNEDISDSVGINSQNKVNKLKQKIEEFSKILGVQKEKLKAYSDRRIELYKQFKKYETKKEENIELKKQFEKSLKDSQSSLSSLTSLIEKLIKTLDEKTLQLSNLKTQGPVVII